MAATSNDSQGPATPVPDTPPALLPGKRWRRVFPGEERRIGDMRRWLASLLPDHPGLDDLVTVASELATNSIRHTRSGSGGWFAVELAWYGQVARVTVADQGGPDEPRVIDDPLAEHGRGLVLVRGLAVRTGVRGDQSGRVIWADVRCDMDLPGPPGEDAQLAVARAGEMPLARRLGGVPA